MAATLKTNFKNGFTLIELALIILLVGILAIVSIPRMPDITAMRVQKAAQKIQSDIRYAQRLAMDTQITTAVVFDINSNSYTIYLVISLGIWNKAKNPITQKDFDVKLDIEELQGVHITEANFNTFQLILFDKYGKPTNLFTPFTGTGYVRLNDIKDIQVTQNTGYLTIIDL